MRTPIDKLSFGFGMLAASNAVSSNTNKAAVVSEGVIVHGLFIESASWDFVS
jgi:hypothetical protein